MLKDQMENLAVQCQTISKKLGELYTLTEEMRRILEASAKNPLYVFSIMDDGQLKRVIVRESFDEFKAEAQSSLEEYLAENGHNGYTEDGYAAVYLVHPEASEAEQYVWSYCFDGEESIEDAIQRLDKPSSILA